jgi:NAD(P)-dependent dehydrogenase (short-subunit alcohol dehydrogenase family)
MRLKKIDGDTALAAGVAAGLVAWQGARWLREADLTGNVALVTGGSRGLGFIVARELLKEGCTVAICARDAAELERARLQLDATGERVFAFPCDVADEAQVQQLVAEVTARFGRVDVLVNNAGIIQSGSIRRQTVEDFQSAMAIMFWGTVYPTLAVLPQMLERRGGRIANVTSIGGKVAIPHLAPYCSAKFAATGFSEGLRAELARYGVTVTTICPGLMRTGSHLNASFKAGDEREFALFAPLGTLPPFSMDAERAARQIVRALKRGDAERTLSVPATLAARFHGLFPGLTSDLLGLVNRFLPDAPGEGMAGTLRQDKGRAIQERLQSPLFEKLTGWGISAAERFNGLPGPSPTVPEHERDKPLMAA